MTYNPDKYLVQVAGTFSSDSELLFDIFNDLAVLIIPTLLADSNDNPCHLYSFIFIKKGRNRLIVVETSVYYASFYELRTT